MASFAQLDENNHVINVLKISNEEILDENGIENEELGIQRCRQIVGDDNSLWVQTWFGTVNESKRFRTAIVDGEYIPEYDVFVKRKPFPSWTLNTETYEWEPPIERPGKVLDRPVTHAWNEDSLSWIEQDISKPDEENEWEWNTEKGFWQPVGITTS